VLHEIKQKQITQREAASRLKISDRHIRRLLVGLGQRGDRALIHGRGRPSNRRLAAQHQRIQILGIILQDIGVMHTSFIEVPDVQVMVPQGIVRIGIIRKCFGQILGSFRFKTIKPGRVTAPDGTLQAPHIAVSVFMRGLLRRLVARIYFPGEPSNAEDFALKLVETDRRHTLIAKKAGNARFEWNVVLQGEDETVFFDC
jgi:hypothetical protein